MTQTTQLPKHTPGPWFLAHIDKKRQTYIATIVAEPSKLEVATLSSFSYDELLANVELILDSVNKVTP